MRSWRQTQLSQQEQEDFALGWVHSCSVSPRPVLPLGKGSWLSRARAHRDTKMG